MRELLLCKAVPPRWGTAYAALLAEGGLRDEGHADITALLTENDTLLGCGSLGGKVIRQVAVSPAAEGQDVCARIVSALVQESVKRNVPYPFLFTKPQNARLFRSLGFYPVAETADMVMLCRQRDALGRFLAPLPRWQEGVTGCVVCHANPFTRGHLHLITTAAAQCDHVLVFVVAEGGGPCRPPAGAGAGGNSPPQQRDRVLRRRFFGEPNHLPCLFSARRAVRGRTV